MPDRSGLYWQERFDEALLGIGWCWGNLYCQGLRRCTHTLEFEDVS